MSDSERPLSSEEMLRRARERLDGPRESDAASAPEPIETTGAVTKPPAPESLSDTPPVEDLTPFKPEVSIPQKGRTRRIPGRLIIFLLIMGGIFVYNFFTDAKRDDTGAVVEAGEVSADQIQVGDCLLYPADAQVSQEFEFESLTAVPCSEPHHMEVFAAFERSDPVYPGQDALFDIAGGLCAAEFEAYTGVGADVSARLVTSSIVPDSQAWSNGDTELLCVVESFDQAPLTGSQEGQGLLGFAGLEVGGCYATTETDTYIGFTELSCDSPHDLEMYAAVEMTEGQSASFPGETPINDFADEECFKRFEGYVGQTWAFGESPDYVWVTPNEESWTFGDRIVQCLLVDPDGGTLQGSPGSDA